MGAEPPAHLGHGSGGSFHQRKQSPHPAGLHCQIGKQSMPTPESNVELEGVQASVRPIAGRVPPRSRQQPDWDRRCERGGNGGSGGHGGEERLAPAGFGVGLQAPDDLNPTRFTRAYCTSSSSPGAAELTPS
jgi:hypothetical protein